MNGVRFSMFLHYFSVYEGAKQSIARKQPHITFPQIHTNVDPCPPHPQALDKAYHRTICIVESDFAPIKNPQLSLWDTHPNPLIHVHKRQSLNPI